MASSSDRVERIGRARGPPAPASTPTGDAGQRRAGRGVRGDPPAGQPGAHPPGQAGVGGDQGAGLARASPGPRAAAGRRRSAASSSVAGGDAERPQSLGDGVDAAPRGLAPQLVDLGAPVGGGFGGPQRLVDHPPAPAAARRRAAAARPATTAPRSTPARSAALHRALRMVLADLAPGLLGQVWSSPGSTTQPSGAAAITPAGRRWPGPSRSSRRRPPQARRIARATLRQAAQQRDAAGGDVHQPELASRSGQAPQRRSEELGADAASAGRGRPRPGRPAAGRRRPPRSGSVEEAAPARRPAPGRRRRRASVERRRCPATSPASSKRRRQGGDGRRQVQRQIAGLERRLALVQVAQGADLRQQQRPAAGAPRKAWAQAPRAPRRVGSRTVASARASGPPRRGHEQARRPGRRETAGARRNGEPARRRSRPEQAAHRRARPPARFGRVARGSGSPTCIHSAVAAPRRTAARRAGISIQ